MSRTAPKRVIDGRPGRLLEKYCAVILVEVGAFVGTNLQQRTGDTSAMSQVKHGPLVNGERIANQGARPPMQGLKALNMLGFVYHSYPLEGKYFLPEIES